MPISYNLGTSVNSHERSLIAANKMPRVFLKFHSPYFSSVSVFCVYNPEVSKACESLEARRLFFEKL
jgi:hypothetical protein